MDKNNIPVSDLAPGSKNSKRQKSNQNNTDLIDMAAEQFAAILWEHVLYEESKRKKFNADTGSRPP
jgi:prophage maintenance system killer protein